MSSLFAAFLLEAGPSLFCDTVYPLLSVFFVKGRPLTGTFLLPHSCNSQQEASCGFPVHFPDSFTFTLFYGLSVAVARKTHDRIEQHSKLCIVVVFLLWWWTSDTCCYRLLLRQGCVAVRWVSVLTCWERWFGAEDQMQQLITLRLDVSPLIYHQQLCLSAQIADTS